MALTVEEVQSLAQTAGVSLKYFSKEEELEGIMKMITADLSEPYSIYTYRYFVYNWPQLCIMAFDKNDIDQKNLIGVIVCKLDVHHKRQTNRGYIAMLAVHPDYRKRKIGTLLVKKAILTMQV
jgi:N-alpha-acetyltransferase 30